MKRREFGVLAGTGLIGASATGPALAQAAAPDASLLTTTLTPLGAERAGNADGSIPAWTGGMSAPATTPDQVVDIQVFTDEKPLYTVNAGNMAQYQNLLSQGTQAQIQKFGLSLQVYQTHRTAAAPQYVYDNTAQNVSRTKPDPRGGRFGFTGAYAGPPYPIIDTAEPLVGGAQLIWNHLTAWSGYSYYTTFSPFVLVTNGRMLMSDAVATPYEYPYYDPNGSAEAYDGYYSKIHVYYVAPSSSVGQEQVVWHSSNIGEHPDIVWELLNGQGRVRKAPDLAYDTPNPATNGISNMDESQGGFYGNPSQYDWKYIGKQELLVPYHNNNLIWHTSQEIMGPHFPNPDLVRWEKHRVWIVEGTLHPGNSNVLARRRYYIDEDSWYAVQGEAYDASGQLAKAYAIYTRVVPSFPGVVVQSEAIFNLLTGDYVILGNTNYPPGTSKEYARTFPPSEFEPQQMAAKAGY